MHKLESFHNLTARGQTRRLRKLAEAALRHYDLKVIRMRLLAHAVNTLFRLDTENDGTWVLRINLPDARSREEIHSEMTWLNALAGVGGLHVPNPLRAKDGSLVVMADADGVPEARHCAVFSWVPGVNLHHRAILSNLEKMGECMARLHVHAESASFPDSFKLKKGQAVFGVSGKQVLFGEHASPCLNVSQRAHFESAAYEAQTLIDQLFAGCSLPIPIHGDLHQGNVKVFYSRLFVFDFDDSFLGYPVQDIAISSYYLQFLPDADQLWQSFMTGYARLRSWPDISDDQIRVLSAGRALDVLNHILQSQNPALVEIAPRYIEFTAGYLEGIFKQSG